MQRFVRFDEPRVERRRCGGRVEQGGRAVTIRRAKQLPEELFGAPGRVQVQRHADAGAFEAAPQLVALDRDAAAIDLNDETPRCIGGIEPGLERRIDGPEEPVDLAAPGDLQPALAQQRLRRILEAGGMAIGDLGDSGLCLDSRDPRRRAVQRRLRQSRQVLQQRRW